MRTAVSDGYRTVGTTLGPITVVAADGGVAGLYMDLHRYRPQWSTFGPHDPAPLAPLLDDAAAQLTAYLDGTLTDFDLPLSLRGNDFQLPVWQVLLQIPYGETVTYGEVARRAGVPGQAQAVGTAVGRNPVSIVVPCHRVVGADGSLTGYAGGLDRKAALLTLESRVAGHTLI
jgi:methylated-DNA-[protein]-cysteine S-methyltransferase